MLTRLLTATVAALAGLTLVPAHADAWSSAPDRWADTTIKVYAPVPTSWGVGRAVTDWNKSGAVTLVMVASPCSECITVSEGTPPAPPDDTRVLLGSAQLAMSPTDATAVVGCHITLNPLYSEQMEAFGTAAHEVGHCLGLAHNSHRWSVMQEIGPELFDRPTGRDLMRLTRLYRSI